MTTELVNVSDNSHIWGAEYNRKVSDILPLQEELARTISEKLRLRLSNEQQKKIVKQGTQNLEAYALYVRGRHSWDKLTEDGFNESVNLLQECRKKISLTTWAI